ncbi:hypothetical protein K449DRAFT_427544 [Hypoxylon sp. EC38]|nr:hypothetical protein K449DRAFT_427544 [Hypoxylon sp. EC38]
MVSVLLRNGADPNFVTGYGIDNISIWMKTLAFVIATYAADPSLPDLWVEVLRDMVTHGANIDTKTINEAMRLTTSEYHVPLDRLKFTVSGLQRHFRSMRYEQGQYGSSFVGAIQLQLGRYSRSAYDYKYLLQPSQRRVR